MSNGQGSTKTPSRGRRALEAELQVGNQREQVARLERDGCDTAQPIQLLEQLEEVMRAIHLADRDWLRKELGS